MNKFHFNEHKQDWWKCDWLIGHIISIMKDTANPIDVKIRLQITSIEVYFLGFFFGVHLAFKGKFRSILVMIHDQSCLNMIAIESRTQGDHEELKILLQNFLIASRFNRKLSLRRKEHLFMEEKSRKRGPSNSLKRFLTAEIGRFWWATIPRSPNYHQSDLHRRIHMKPRVVRWVAEDAI